jgi:hypothetical protein
MCAKHYQRARINGMPTVASLPGLSLMEVLADLDGRLTYRMLDYWVRTGAVTLQADARGSGSRRRVSPAEAAAIKDLLDFYEQTQHQLERLRSGALFAELLAYHAEDTRALRAVQ